MEKKIKILPPMMPNFVILDINSNERTMSITELTKEEAEEYAELMKQEFIKHWNNKTK
jgi:hypothetical protein